ncbi:MAG TPA: FG-GAP repeat protein [Nitrososphaeraceae archaeon]|nr:FG-GAP repeat protein [Nitrososphaeraceae archaeon]
MKKIYQQNTKFNDTLEKTRVLVCVFLLAVLSLLSISFLFSDVNAIEVKADFNGDGKDDLAIGIPSEDIGSTKNGGAVEVLYGSSSGLSATSPPVADQFWTQDSPDIYDASENGDLFGRFLSAIDFNGDGKDDVAIGIPNEDVRAIEDAGAVQVLYGSSKGLSGASPLLNQFWTQGSTNVNDVSEQFDHFGWPVG